MLNFSKKIKNEENINTIERRKAADKWFYVTRGLAISAWLLFLFALIMSYYAAPETNYGALRYKGIEIRQFWLTPLTGYLYIVLWFSALHSYLYLLVERFRTKRSNDKKLFSPMLLLAITLTWLVYLLLHIMG